MKLDERMFFLWTKEDLADTKKLGSSCEDMEAYHERLRVFFTFWKRENVFLLHPAAAAFTFPVQAWKSLIVVSGSPYRIDTNTNIFADQVHLFS